MATNWHTASAAAGTHEIKTCETHAAGETLCISTSSLAKISCAPALGLRRSMQAVTNPAGDSCCSVDAR